MFDKKFIDVKLHLSNEFSTFKEEIMTRLDDNEARIDELQDRIEDIESSRDNTGVNYIEFRERMNREKKYHFAKCI